MHPSVRPCVHTAVRALFKVPPPRSRVLRAEEAQQLRDERAPLVAQRAVRHELVRGEERAEVRAARRRRRSRRGALGARPVPRVEDADLPNRSSIRILSAEYASTSFVSSRKYRDRSTVRVRRGASAAASARSPRRTTCRRSTSARRIAAAAAGSVAVPSVTTMSAREARPSPPGAVPSAIERPAAASAAQSEALIPAPDGVQMTATSCVQCREACRASGCSSTAPARSSGRSAGSV